MEKPAAIRFAPLVENGAGAFRQVGQVADRRGDEGLTRALELILGGRTLTAEEATAIGLIDRVTDSAGPMFVNTELQRARFGGVALVRMAARALGRGVPRQ